MNIILDFNGTITDENFNEILKELEKKKVKDYYEEIKQNYPEIYMRKPESNKKIRDYYELIKDNPYFKKDNILPSYLYNDNVLEYYPTEIPYLSLRNSLFWLLIDLGLSIDNAKQISKDYSMRLLKNVKQKISKSTIEAIKELKERGYRIVIISGSPKDLIEETLEEYKIRDYIDEIYSINKSKGYGERYLDVFGTRISVEKPDYYELIRNLNPVIVVGDQFSIDLAVPYYYGYRVALRKREYTPPIFLYFSSNKNIPIINSLKDLLKLL